MDDFEKLGAFYLGRPYDLAKKQGQEGVLLYDSKDLVTHAVCVGMTGSGKTGLCISLLEEAAIDSIPAIVIDPKGDLANLLLTFPDLKPEDFRPWVNEDDARKKGISADDFAKQQAELWSKGLSQWGQDGARIAKLKAAADFEIYTPGSNAGIPVSILKSFAAPPQEVIDDNEMFQERIRTTATSLLGLIGEDADPIQSREHILLSNLLANTWKQGKDIDLGGLIQQIQQPPMQRVGVLDMESFFPSKDRFGLAMSLNNLLAAPGFESWLSGAALDIGQLLHSDTGKPRISIFSIAHLSDAERMFFVSLLLNQMLGWVRTQSGTTSLRALLYMDEIFGYFPPTANPPSKAPLLTLLKQARAFGVGVVLATQNPVDLDYKGLSNAGTWFIGRLQTDRDKQRVLDGLEGAAAGSSGRFDRGQMEQTLAGLGNRVFLMNNVNEDAPVVFETRWAMSYLRGPLTRSQIKTLMDPKRPSPATPAPAKAPSPGGVATSVAMSPASSVATQAAAPVSAATTSSRPVLPAGVPQIFIPLRSDQPSGATLLYRPMILGSANVYFNDPKKGLDVHQSVMFGAKLADGPVVLDWQNGEALEVAEADLEKEPQGGASFATLPTPASQVKNYDNWKKSLAEALYRTSKLSLMRSGALKVVSNPGESERDFRVRLQQIAREKRDVLKDEIRTKYGPKVAMIQDRIRRAQAQVDVQSQQASASKWQTAISFGSTVLGALLGRKTFSAGNIGRATTAARGVSRSMKESSDVGRAEENVDAIKQQLETIESQMNEEMAGIDTQMNAAAEQLETVPLKPKKSDIEVRTVALAWAPYWKQGDDETSAYE
jgi:hypothetical protein